MQPNLESGMPGVTPQILFEAQGALSENEEPRSQPAELISAKRVLCNIEQDKSYRGIFQKSQAKGHQGIGGRQRPSPRIWHYILLSGDVILLVALLELLLFFHWTPQVSRS